MQARRRIFVEANDVGRRKRHLCFNDSTDGPIDDSAIAARRVNRVHGEDASDMLDTCALVCALIFCTCDVLKHTCTLADQNAELEMKWIDAWCADGTSEMIQCCMHSRCQYVQTADFIVFLIVTLQSMLHRLFLLFLFVIFPFLL